MTLKPRLSATQLAAFFDRLEPLASRAGHVTILLQSETELSLLWQLCLALQQHPQLPPWRLYVAGGDEALLTHPYLAPLAAGGQLLAGEPEPDGGLLLLVSDGALAAAPHLAMSMQYGNLWQAPHLDSPSARWRQAQAPVPWQPLIDDYRQLLTCSDFTLPTGASERLDGLAKQWPGGMLCLALEPATTNLHQLRAGTIHQRPLNLDALAQQQSAQGGGIAIIPVDDSHSLFLTCRGAALDAAGFEALCRSLDGPALASAASLLAVAKASPQALSQCDQLPQWLALAHHDPAFLQALPEPCLRPPEPWNETRFEAWRQALLRTWHQYLPLAQNAEALFRFSALFELTGQWGLLRDALSWVDHWFEPQADWLAILAGCEAATGNLAQACQVQSQALSLAPGNRPLAEALSQYQQRLAGQRQLAPACTDPEAPLRLEPLGPQHNEVFAWQYRDPQIAIMSGLPPAPQGSTAPADWPAEHHDSPGKRNFALMHRQLGFVGVVAYELRGQSAYVSYWLGTDFQGLGLSAPALALLAEQARHQGAKVLFTSVYTHNRRSLRTLEKGQFQQLPITPSEQEAMYYFAKQMDGQAPLAPERLQAMLRELCQTLGSPLPDDQRLTG